MHSMTTIKTDITLSLSECLQDLLIQRRDNFRYHHLQECFPRSYIYLLLFKDQHIIFLHLTLLRHDIFPYILPCNVTENESGHTVLLRCIPGPDKMLLELKVQSEDQGGSCLRELLPSCPGFIHKTHQLLELNQRPA